MDNIIVLEKILVVLFMIALVIYAHIGLLIGIK